MSLKKVFAFCLLIFAALYFAKNIEISVTGAEALVDDLDNEELSFQATEAIQKPSKVQSINSEVPPLVPTPIFEMSSIDQMAQFLKNQQLCEFLAFTKEKSLGKFEQWLALEKSFSDPEIKEITVFLEADSNNIAAYETEAAQFYLLAQNIGAFIHEPRGDFISFENGLLEEDQKKWSQIEMVAKLNSENLLYPMAMHNLLKNYSHRSESIDEQIYQAILSSDIFDNPIHSLVSRVFNKSKENVAQFYVSQEIFEKKVSLDRHFVMQVIWYYYSEETRAHVNQIMKSYLDRNNDSSLVFGYEPNLYELYKNSAYSELFLSLPAVNEYEKSRDQPVYTLSELKLEFDQTCDQNKVDQLAIKLRSL